jgi:hypothetical protein
VCEELVVFVQNILVDQIGIVRFRLNDYVDKVAEVCEPMREMRFVGVVMKKAIDFWHHFEWFALARERQLLSILSHMQFHQAHIQDNIDYDVHDYELVRIVKQEFDVVFDQPLIQVFYIVEKFIKHFPSKSFGKNLN